MKIRNLPFGYRYDSGIIGHDKTERQVYLRITDMYISGMSLKNIANTLNGENIEYAPGVVGWNKSRIMRLLSDERYTGSGKYPAMISREMYDLILAQRDNNSVLNNTDLSSGIYRLNVPLICPDCGNHMKRVRVGNKKGRQRWHCQSCDTRIYLNDNELLADIEKHLMRFTERPELIIAEESSSIINEDREITDLNTDIESALERPDMYVEAALEKIRRLATLRYKAISEQYYTALKLRADFHEASQLCQSFRDKWTASMIDLANRTIKEIHLSDLGQVRIVLMNGQISSEGV